MWIPDWLLVMPERQLRMFASVRAVEPCRPVIVAWLSVTAWYFVFSFSAVVDDIWQWLMVCDVCLL